MQTECAVKESGEIAVNKYFMVADILEASKNNGRLMPIGKTYDCKTFWDGLGQDYFKRFKKKEHFQVNVAWIIDRLKILKLKTLLDAGCGFGRVAPFLLDAGVIEKIDGFDIAPSILKSSEEYLAEEEKEEGKEVAPNFKDKISLSEGDVRAIKLDSGSYDVVLSCELLQHISPEDVEDAVRELVRVAKKAIIFVERWSFPNEHSEPHMWSHNIGEILTKLGVRVEQVTPINSGVNGILALKQYI